MFHCLCVLTVKLFAVAGVLEYFYGVYKSYQDFLQKLLVCIRLLTHVACDVVIKVRSFGVVPLIVLCSLHVRKAIESSLLQVTIAKFDQPCSCQCHCSWFCERMPLCVIVIMPNRPGTRKI